MWTQALKLIEYLGWTLLGLATIGTVLSLFAFVVVLLEELGRWWQERRLSRLLLRRWRASSTSEDLSERGLPYLLPPAKWSSSRRRRYAIVVAAIATGLVILYAVWS